MLHERIKFNYELHYGLTNRTGRQHVDHAADMVCVRMGGHEQVDLIDVHLL